MSISTHSHTHAPKTHTYTNPTSVPTAGEQRPVGHLQQWVLPTWLHRARSCAGKETGWWIGPALAAHHPKATVCRWWQIHPGKKGPALTFLSALKREKQLMSCFPVHMNTQTIWALIRFGLEHGTVPVVQIFFWTSRETYSWSAPLEDTISHQKLCCDEQIPCIKKFQLQEALALFRKPSLKSISRYEANIMQP